MLLAWLPVFGAQAVDFDQWRAQVFSGTELSDPATSDTCSDPSRTGVPNILAYALGVDPHAPRRALLPAHHLDAGGRLTMVYSMRADAADLVYTPEISSDLKHWSSDGATLEILPPADHGNGWQSVTVRDLAGAGGTGKRFMRLQVRLDGTNGKILPDAWQRQYFGRVGMDSSADSDGDGLSDWEEYLAGSDPTDYFSRGARRIVPRITILAGKNQSGIPGDIAPVPLTVLLTDGTNPLVNAPLTFSVSGLPGNLSLLPDAGPGLTGTLAVRTGNDGCAAVYSIFPVPAKSQLRVVVTAAQGTPVSIGLSACDVISAGAFHTMVVRPDGTVRAWGDNRCGQLGDGTLSQRNSPVRIFGEPDGVRVVAGAAHSFFLGASGVMSAWGDGMFGALGIGTQTGMPAPTPVAGIGGVRQVAAGDGFSVALTVAGSVYAWGDGSAGQLGTGGSTAWSLVPAQVPGLREIRFVAAGRATVYAVDARGEVLVWGDNSYSQAGVEGAGILPEPVPLAGVSGSVTAVSAGAAHALLLTADGKVRSFGANWFGQLGRNNRDADPAPGLVVFPMMAEGKRIVAIAAGGYHSLALDEDGNVYAWGAGWSGQNGSGDGADVVIPALVKTGVTAITAGMSHSAALGFDGTVYTWGDNARGQLGRVTEQGWDSAPAAVQGF